MCVLEMATISWEQRKLSSIAEEVTRTAPESTAPVMMITANNGFIEQSDRYAFNNAGESLQKYILLEKGEMAYNHGASKLRPYGSCFALTTAESARIPFVYHCFRVGENDPEFVSMELNGSRVENQLRRIVSSGARMDGLLNISYEEYSCVELMVPSVPEQKRLADYFRQLDTLITLHQRKYDALVKVKKAMLEKMFPKGDAKIPEIRFAGFSDAWEQRKLSSVVERVTRKNVNLESSLPLTISAQYGLVDQVSYFNNRVASDNISNYFLVKKGEFAYNKSSSDGYPYGTIKRLNLYEMGILSTLYIVFALKDSNVDSDFLETYFDTDNWHKHISECAAEGARNHGLLNISADDFLDLTLTIPKSKEEQAQIGSYLKRLDNLITLHQRKLERLKNIKKAMLQKMFV